MILYKVNYELDNGCRYEDRCSVIVSSERITTENEFKEKLYKLCNRSSCELITKIYKFVEYCDVSDDMSIVDFEVS